MYIENAFLVTPSVSSIYTKKYLILETFLGVLLNRISDQGEVSPLLEQHAFSRALCHTYLVHKLFQPARGGSKLSIGTKLQ